MKKLLTVLLGLSLFLTGCSEESDEVLVIGLECNYAPFNWTVSDSNDSSLPINQVNAFCDGYDIDIASYIANELEKEVVIKKIEWDGLIPALLSGQIDVIIAGMSPTEARKETVSFTNPYYRSEQVLVVKSDSSYVNATSLEDFSNAKVIAQLNTLQDSLIDQINNVVHQTALSDYPSLVESVKSNVSDALVAELPVALSIIASNSDLTYVSLPENGFTVLESDVSVSVALRKNDNELLNQINEVLEILSKTSRDTLMQEALNRQP